ncbi:uncharacterized protein LOC110973386 [Acanthaster planci]|uniref:Uncharacterized protein LOC110973386 n=1 Tax=Acanthaster planci TaxID=133434 RepID=A0A8B7XGG8_ACAPL|nr:uncharacterized protein LOC110973386 [Acanthaster planci]
MAGFISNPNSGIFLWCVVSLSFLTSLSTDTCPDSCRCHGNTLKCTPNVNGGIKLLKVPPDLLRYNLFHIKYANLSRNRLQQIEPGDFLGLPRVIRLDLRHNRLRALLRNGFSGLEDLMTLQLSYNVIRYIDRFAFEGLTKVRKIDLSHNEIAFIEDDSFKTRDGLITLLSLDLSFNQLYDLHGPTFLGLESLQELYLNHNSLRAIHTEVFATLQQLEKIYLGRNFINCTCEWLEVWSNLQSRDIEMMDTSDALKACTEDVIICDNELEPSDIPDEDFDVATSIAQVAYNLIMEDLIPPETDGHGNIVDADGNSFPLWSPEGERVLSAHDGEMRRRIGEVEDRDLRRMFTVTFQERMRGFLKRMMKHESTTTARATTSEITKESNGVQEMNSDKYNATHFINVTMTHGHHQLPLDPKIAKFIADATTLIKDIFRLVFPTGGFFSSSEISLKALGTSGLFDPARIVSQITEAQRGKNRLVEAKPSAPETSKAAPTTRPTSKSTSRYKPTKSPILVLGTSLPQQSAFKWPEIQIPFFAGIGIFVFVCIAAAAIAMFSGACRDGSRFCECSWLSTVSEKLALRKLHIERQSRKTSPAKSDFVKMHCLAKQTIDASAASKVTSPDKIQTEVAADDRGIVSVTPLVLTEEFPNKSGTTPPKSQASQDKTSLGLLGYLKSRLSSYQDTPSKETPKTSPRDEITLFDISVERSVSEPNKTVTGKRETANDIGQPVQLTDVHAAVSENLPAKHTAVSGDSVDTSVMHRGKSLDVVASDGETGVTRTSSDLRWYAKECLSNQRMMTQARTHSMTSSNDDKMLKKADPEDDGIW